MKDRAFLTVFLLILFSALSSCAGRSLGRKQARDIIADYPGVLLEKEEVYIESVTQTGRRDAVVEATLHAGFKFEREGDRWVIKEVRLGERPWENLADLLAALERIKADETRKILEEVAAAAGRYHAAKGSLPEFKDFISLSDALNPDFMSPLIREDRWHRPLAAYKSGVAGVRLVSAGPDGKFGSPDDIELIRTYP